MSTAPERVRPEFVALVALTMSLIAMSIDGMLPALGQIADDLALADPNDRQLVLTLFFVGLSVGQLAFGAMADSMGRKPTLYAGISLFVLGGLCCALARDFSVMLVGRALQGFGAAGPRITAVATVRDLHTGNAMARVMSFVSLLFVLVPIAAPSLGQLVLLIADWRAIFWGYVVMALIDVTWFGLRQPETLPRERRVPLGARRVAVAAGEVLKHPIALCYTIAMGCIFAPVLAYLATSQQIFQEQYGVGALYPVLFGLLAASLGVAALTNANLVMRFGMRRLARSAATLQLVLAISALLAAAAHGGHPPLWMFIATMMGCFFFNGLQFGNYNARALEPMGHIAGVATAISGSLSSVVAIALGTPLGRAYDGSVYPVIAGFVLSSASALALTEGAEVRFERTRAAAE